MKGKKKTTIELCPEEVEAIIKAYFVKKKDVVIQDVHFNIETVYDESYVDEHGSEELVSIICTREDDIEI